MTLKDKMHSRLRYKAEDFTHTHIRKLVWVHLLEKADYRALGQIVIDLNSVDNIKDIVQDYLLHYELTKQD